VREFARADSQPVASSLFFEIYERLPQDTDFSIYKRAGVMGLNFALAEGADAYHRPTDTIENLSAASLQHHGEHALALSRHFGNLDLAAPRQARNVVYFGIPGLGLASYSYGFAIVLFGAALVLSGVVIERGIAARRLTRVGLAGGLGASILAAMLAAAAAALLLLLIRAVHHEVGSIVARELYHEGWYGLAVACVAAASYATVLAIARRRIGAASLAAGALVIPLVLAGVTTFYVPGVSMLFIWPAIFAALAVAWMSRLHNEPFGVRDVAILALCAAGAILVFFPLVWAVYIGFSIAGAPVFAAVIVLMLAFAVPLFEVTVSANRWWLPVTASCLAVVFTVVGIANARPGPERPVPEDLVYGLDRDSGEAFWATSRPSGSVWLSEFFGAGTRQGDLSAFLVERGPYRLAPAPLVESARAGISIASDGTETQPRAVRVDIRPGLVSELVTVAPTAGGATRLRAVNGVAVAEGTSADQPEWKLQHFGRPPNGVLVLDLEIQNDEAPIELVIVEGVMHLPALPGVERPPDVTPHADRLTDISLFRQVVRVE
jgi:MFS family permease